MNFRDQLLLEHSKNNALLIAQYINGDRKLFSELIDIIKSGENPASQRAAMVLNYCHDLYPDMTAEFTPNLIKLLKNNLYHDAIRRSSLRTLGDHKINKNLQGELADICFNLLNEKATPIAIKVFGMEVLKNIVLENPELKNELLFSLEEQLPFQSAGFKSRARKIIKKISHL